MAILVLDGIIRAGESLSEPLDCSHGDLLRLIMPEEWTDASLTFQLSEGGEGAIYHDAFNLDGYEVMLPAVVPGCVIVIPFDVARAVAWIKFRSGTRTDPVVQTSQREFKVAINTFGESPGSPSKPQPPPFNAEWFDQAVLLSRKSN